MENKRLVNFMADPAEIESWKDHARSERLSFSAWLRKAARNLSGEIPAAPIVYKPEVVKTQAIAVAEQLKERASKVASVKSECLNRLPKGTFCNRCGRTH